MGRIILLVIGFIAGWFLKDGDWEVWLEKLKSYFEPQERSEQPIPLLEDEVKATEPDAMEEVFSDELEELKGIGPASKTKLNEKGIYTFAQIAALSPEKLKEIAGGRVSAETVLEEAKKRAG